MKSSKDDKRNPILPTKGRGPKRPMKPCAAPPLACICGARAWCCCLRGKTQ